MFTDTLLSFRNGIITGNDAFLNALTRMVARKGWPKLMLSDNVTHYVGAARKVKELVKNINQDKLQRLNPIKESISSSIHQEHHTSVVYLKA